MYLQMVSWMDIVLSRALTVFIFRVELRGLETYKTIFKLFFLSCRMNEILDTIFKIISLFFPETLSGV